MVLPSSLVVACYLAPHGTHHGWLTIRSTLTQRLDKARRFESQADADKAVARLERTWPDVYLWSVEATDTVRLGDMEIDLHGATPVIDTQPGHGVPSALNQPSTSSSARLLDDTDGTKGDNDMAKTGSKKPVATKSKPATKGALKGKPQFRATASPSPAAAKTATKESKRGAKRAAAAKTAGSRSNECLCGCGQMSTNYFLRGHIKRAVSNLNKVKLGLVKPEKAFGAKIAKAMSPWRGPNRSGGFVPTTTDYDKIRAALG